MNGWQRIFVVFAVVICLPVAGIWISQLPKRDGPQFSANCYDLQEGYSFTPAEAKALLEQHAGKVASHTIRESDRWRYYDRHDQPVMWDDCAASLRDVVSGKAYATAKAEWWETGTQGAMFLAAFLGVVYAMGWALGWIWRGFFPKRAT